MTVTKRLVMAKDIGCNGNLFGGNMLAWMDEAAAIYAMEYTGEPHMVTVNMSEITFKRAVKEGTVLNFECSAIEEGNTSFKFALVVQDRSTGEHVCGVTCTFVAVDCTGHKKTISKFEKIREREIQ